MSDKRSGSTLLVLAARVLLLLAALALAVTGAALAFGGRKQESATATYACPMHAEVTSAAPAQCPICKMELEPLGGGSQRASKPAPAAPKAEPGVKHAYVCPMHPEVTSASPGTCPECKMELEPVTAAKPEAPARPVIPVVSHTFASGTTWLPETFPPADQSKPGDRVALGTLKRRVVTDGVRAPAWFEAADRVAALLYQDELGTLAPGQLGTLFRALAPRVPIEVRLSEEPPSTWDGSTSIVRFELDAAQGARAGDIGWLEIASLSRELSVLPETAVLRSDQGPYVLVPRGQHYVRRPVETGRTFKGNVVVLSGLGESEHVVVGGAFFLDIEHRHASASSGGGS